MNIVLSLYITFWSERMYSVITSTPSRVLIFFHWRCCVCVKTIKTQYIIMLPSWFIENYTIYFLLLMYNPLSMIMLHRHRRYIYLRWQLEAYIHVASYTQTHWTKWKNKKIVKKIEIIVQIKETQMQHTWRQANTVIMIYNSNNWKGAPVIDNSIKKIHILLRLSLKT